MKTYKLSSDDLVFFKKYFPVIYFETLIVNNLEDDDKYLLTLSKEQADMLVEELANLFCNIGLKEDSEPNEMGFYIEDYIDKFNPIYHKDNDKS